MPTRKSDEKKAEEREERKDEERTKSRLATEENTPEQPLGTDDTPFELSDIAPAPVSGDIDHLNPGVPGDLPNELPAKVPTSTEMTVTGGIGPISETAHESQVNAGTKVRGNRK